MSFLKNKIIILIIVILAIALILFLFFSQKPAPQTPAQNTKPSVSTEDKPQIVSTTPDPLDNTIIPATQTIEITFNRPLENVGEFKLRMEPKIDYKLELSGDRKTAKIIPVKPYALGTGYTIFIGTETKFDGIGRWGEEKIYHYQTIKYTGV